MSDEPVTEARQVRPFAAFLQEQRGGVTHSELSEQLAELVAAVMSTGKPGALTYKLNIKPSGDGVSVFVTDTIAIKTPQGERSVAIFFADSDGNLSRKDPRQLELSALREVPMADVREADA